MRAARPGEADALTALCIRSKAHWGYDAEFMRLSVPALTVKPAMIKRGRVVVAEDTASLALPRSRGREGRRLLGVAAVTAKPSPGKFDLALMFVEPAVIGNGVGRMLFEAAVRLAADQGAVSLSILADPFAAGFYRRLGAVEIGDAPSDAIPGRRVPLLECTINKAPSPTDPLAAKPG